MYGIIECMLTSDRFIEVFSLFKLMFSTDMFVTYCVHNMSSVLFHIIKYVYESTTHSLEIGRHTATITKSVLNTVYKQSLHIILLFEGSCDHNLYKCLSRLSRSSLDSA